MSAHAMLGYWVASVSVVTLAVAIAAHVRDTHALRGALRTSLGVLWLSELAAIVLIVVQSNRPALVRADLLPYVILGSAALLTLTTGLVTWQLVNPQAHLEKQHWVGFLAGATGLPALAVAVCMLCARLV